jgi:tRNA pseudouridine55 synthase
MNSASPSLYGVLNLNKPIGLTSRAALDRVARLVRPAKAGHAGTLDPLASGVLVVLVGKATRLIEHVQRMPKLYRTTIRLGARSDTLDADGAVVETLDPPIPDLHEIHAAVAPQIGTIEQIPPQYSALKVGGKRAYDLARAGQEVALAARPVTIDRIEVLRYEWPFLELEVSCGSGTYIRSIARDIGDCLGCGGLIEVLTRTRIGPFAIEDALDPASLTADLVTSRLGSPLLAVGELPRVNISETDHSRILRGQPVSTDEPLDCSAEIALIGPDGDLVALARHTGGGRLAPEKVFHA